MRVGSKRASIKQNTDRATRTAIFAEERFDGGYPEKKSGNRSIHAQDCLRAKEDESGRSQIHADNTSSRLCLKYNPPTE